MLPPAEPTEQTVAAAAEEQPADSAVGGTPTSAAPPASRPAAKPIAHTEAEPIDLMASAGPALAKRVAPLAIGALVLLFVLLRRRKH